MDYSSAAAPTIISTVVVTADDFTAASAVTLTVSPSATTGNLPVDKRPRRSSLVEIVSGTLPSTILC